MARRRKAAQWEMKPKNNKNGGRRCTRVSVRVNSAPLRLIMRNDRALSASVGPHGRSVTHNLALRPISSIGWTRGANIFQLIFNDFIKARASVMSVQSLWPQSVHRRVSRASPTGAVLDLSSHTLLHARAVMSAQNLSPQSVHRRVSRAFHTGALLDLNSHTHQYKLQANHGKVLRQRTLVNHDKDGIVFKKTKK